MTSMERIVVQATLSDKNAIAAKAKKLHMSVSELMRRAAFAYESDQALDALADAATGAADRAGSAIDDAMVFIATSNERIANMELPASKVSRAATAGSGMPLLSKNSK